jgi:hypothetical protein
MRGILSGFCKWWHLRATLSRVCRRPGSKSEARCFEGIHVYNFKGIDVFEVEGPTQKVAFYYETHMPCTKTPEQLKDIVATILPPLQAMKSASNAYQVHAFV